MKTLFTTITAAASLFISINANAQAMAVSNTEIVHNEATTKTFSISGTTIKSATDGVTVSWEANNQFSVASYELQLSENNNDFSTVKRRTSGPETNVKYQVKLTNTVILANPVYFRIKVITLDGKISYTESTRVRIEEI